MSCGAIVKLVLEIIIAFLLIVGLFNEDKIADWENEMFAKLKNVCGWKKS